MTSSTPTSKPGQQTPDTAAPVEPKPQKPWWRPWLEPILVVTIIIALFTTLVSGGVVMFQSLKGDIVASETRVSERIDRVAARIDRVNEKIETSEGKLREEIQASEARLHEEIRASEDRQNKRIDELRQDNAELRAEFKADMKAMDNKLDRVLEALPVRPTPVQD